MKRYFVNGKEISKAEAEQIIKTNEELMKSNNIEDWAECKFVVII